MILALCPVLVALASDWYVDASANCVTATGGLQAPFCTITEAIEAASDGDRILVAPGTYRENLVLTKDLELIGTSGRDVTIIDGQQLDSVVVQEGGTVVSLRELTLTNGLARYGGGIFVAGTSRLTLTSMTVRDNTAGQAFTVSGGGISISYNSHVEIFGSSFGNNGAYALFSYFYSGASGGSITNSGDSTVVIDGCHIYESYVSAGSLGSTLGSAILNNARLTIKNTLITDSPGFTGVIYNGPLSAALTMTNSTVAYNEIFVFLQGVGLWNYGNATVTNTIFWRNQGYEIAGSIAAPIDVTYCNVEGGFPGKGNIAADPRFTDPANGRFDLLPESPCLEAGNLLSRPTGLDLDGNVRRLDGDLDRVVRVDMGAYEFTNVRLAAGGSAWSDLFVEITGTRGLDAYLVAGRAPGEASVSTWGSTLFDLDSFWFAFPLGTTPVSRTLPIPRDANLPGRSERVILQALVLGAPDARGLFSGNFSNAVHLSLE